MEETQILKHEVIKNGEVLFEKHPGIRYNFEVNSELKYYDFEPYRNFFWESLKKKIRGGISSDKT